MDSQPAALEQPSSSERRERTLIERFGSAEAVRRWRQEIGGKGGKVRVKKGGTKAGAQKGVATRKEKYGPEWPAKIGRKGGRAKAQRSSEAVA